ncbi:hypothetical protein F4782DRAFT_547438 [Xylaria castorea]|nr:hypothetical protein F4782DRAFT_547438 [Xylaria castorea]
MAQGAPKKTGSKPALAGRANKPQPAKTKKGARVMKSKKGSAADKLQRKLAGGITTKTERLLGERAGHLELIGPGKKARGENKDAAANKGGSRKFGRVGKKKVGYTGNTAESTTCCLYGRLGQEPAASKDGRSCVLAGRCEYVG